VARAGAKVGKEAEVLPERQQCSTLGLDVGREVFPLGATYGAEEDGIGLFTGCDGFLRERATGFIDGSAADKVGGVCDFEIKFFGSGVEDVESDVHDFRSDAIAGKYGDGVHIKNVERF